MRKHPSRSRPTHSLTLAPNRRTTSGSPLFFHPLSPYSTVFLLRETAFASIGTLLLLFHFFFYPHRPFFLRVHSPSARSCPLLLGRPRCERRRERRNGPGDVHRRLVHFLLFFIFLRILAWRAQKPHANHQNITRVSPSPPPPHSIGLGLIILLSLEHLSLCRASLSPMRCT